MTLTHPRCVLTSHGLCRPCRSCCREARDLHVQAQMPPGIHTLLILNGSLKCKVDTSNVLLAQRHLWQACEPPWIPLFRNLLNKGPQESFMVLPLPTAHPPVTNLVLRSPSCVVLSYFWMVLSGCDQGAPGAPNTPDRGPCRPLPALPTKPFTHL